MSGIKKWIKKWIKNYGVVTVLGLGVSGSFLLWAVDSQVKSQTADLRTKVDVVETHSGYLRVEIGELKNTVVQLDQRIDVLEREVENIGESTDTILKLLRKELSRDDSALPDRPSVHYRAAVMRRPAVAISSGDR